MSKINFQAFLAPIFGAKGAFFTARGGGGFFLLDCVQSILCSADGTPFLGAFFLLCEAEKGGFLRLCRTVVWLVVELGFFALFMPVLSCFILVFGAVVGGRSVARFSGFFPRVWGGFWWESSPLNTA